jgi:lysophospholipase L1-like esterase
MASRRVPAAVLAVLLAASCGDPPYWRGQVPATVTVAVVGDSYVAQLEEPGSTPALTEVLAAEGWRSHVEARSGWPTDRVRSLVVDAVAEDATAIVVVAGVNDVAWVEHQPDERRARSVVVDDVLAVLDAAWSAGCVVWPTVAPAPVAAHRANRTVRAINETLRRHATDRVLVPEWGRRLRAHRDEWIGPDGLHLSESGATALQAVVTTALQECVDRGVAR